jgi:hypothetical protein
VTVNVWTLVTYQGIFKPITIENSREKIQKIEKVNYYEKQYQNPYKYEKYLNFVQMITDLWNHGGVSPSSKR